MSFAKTTLVATAAVVLLACFVIDHANAAVYENKAVCEHFFYRPFRNVDYCLNCCKAAGYTEKGREEGENASCSCKGERAHPDGDDKPVEQAPLVLVYENDKVCKQVPYRPKNNADQCLSCCKQAGYTDKGEKDYDDPEQTCVCEIERLHKVNVQGERLFSGVSYPNPAFDGIPTWYENSVVCRKIDYYSGRGTDACFDCCKRFGYTEKGKKWFIGSNGACTCKAEKLSQGNNEYRIVRQSQYA